MTAALCPDCRAVWPQGGPSCPRCGLPLTGPVATELGRLDRELVDLDARLAGVEQERARLHARRGQLLSRRAEVIRALRAVARTVTRGGAGAQPGGPFPSAPAGAARDAAGVTGEAAGAVRPAVRTVAEASGHSIQTVLLLLGGLLLAVAAIAFTVFAWSRFGISGRALVLAALTAVLLTLPAALVRLRLPATGETIAAVALVLVTLDGYAAWRVGFLGVDEALPATAYAGLVAAVVTAVAAGYPALVPLRLPRPIGIVTGQAVLPLLAAEYQPGWLPGGTAFALVAAADLAVVWWAARRSATAELVVAAVGAGVAGLVTAGWGVIELTSDALAERAGVGPALLLVALGGLGLVAAELAGGGAARHVAAAGAVLVVAVGGFGVHAGRTEGWPVTGGAAMALLVAVLAAIAPARWRSGGLAGAAAVTALASAIPALWTLLALVAPLSWTAEPWTVSAAEPARLAPGTWLAPLPDVAWAVGTLAVTVALLGWRASGVRALPYAAGGPLAVVALLLPVALDAPLAAALLVEGVVAVGFGVVALLARGRTPRAVLTGLGLLLGAHAALWSVADQAATLVTVGALAAGCAGLAVVGVRRAAQGPAAATGAAALLAVSGETAAVAAALGASRLGVALALLGAALLAVGVAALLYRTQPWPALAALATVPVTATAGVLAGAPGSGRPGVGLLTALAGTVIAAGAVAAQRRSPALSTLAAGGLGVGALAVLPVLVQAVLGPVSWVDAVWAGAPARAGSGLGPELAWSGTPLDVVAVLVLGVGAALLAAAVLGRIRAAVLAAVPVWALAVLMIPLALDAPWPVGLGVVAALALGGAAVAAVTPYRVPAAAFALVLGATALAWSLAARPATITVLALVAAAGAATGVVGRGAAPRLVGAVVAALAAVAEAGVIGAAAGLPRHGVAYPVLAAAAGVATVAAVLRGRRPDEGLGLEFSALAGAVAALYLTGDELWHGALVLTLTGVAVGATALRPDRRPAGYAALGIELVASWLWLAVAEVRTPEAYTLPGALVGVAAGVVALWRRPELSSWTALGPGLAAAFLPSLALVFGGDGSPWRSLLLGTGALAVTVAGAVARRLAALALGAVTVALVALREIWPLLPWVVSSVPAWVPLSVGGALLVVLGATYEQRRHDLRRARRVVARMR